MSGGVSWSRARAPPTVSAALTARPPARPPSPAAVAALDSTVACLWLLTPLSAATAALVVLVAMTTNHWLHTEERMANPAFNGSGENDYLSKHTVSGLWRICYTDPGGSKYRCGSIAYFPPDLYIPDPADSTSAIPYTVTRSVAPLILASGVLLAGCVCCTLGHCMRGRRLCTFIGGVLFVIAGLIMLTGIIMYISVFKSEVGQKLRPISHLESPRMSYRYGYSFGLYVSGFVAIELAGTSAIFLFLQWYQKDWMVEMTERAKLINQAWDREFAVIDLRHREPSLHERRMQKRDTYPPTMQQAASTSRDRRIFFDSEFPAPVAHCTVHRDVYNRRMQCSATSLKDLSSSTVYGFPPAPQAAGCHEIFDFREPPQSANTLSGLRSASIFQSQNSVASGRFLDRSYATDRSRDDFIVVDVGDREELSVFPTRRDRAVGTETFRRTTPV